MNKHMLQAPERCSKLYDSYCKFLLSYDTLPAEEKQRLDEQVLAERDKEQLTANDECVSKVRANSLCILMVIILDSAKYTAAAGQS